MNKIIINILNHTWGIIMTLIGYGARLYMRFKKIQGKDCGIARCYVYKRGWGGVSLGTTIIVSENSTDDTVAHELGHTIQNAMWGVLFPIIIAIPSAIRYRYRKHLLEKGINPKTEYDAIWFEGNATKIGKSFRKNNK